MTVGSPYSSARNRVIELGRKDDSLGKSKDRKGGTERRKQIVKYRRGQTRKSGTQHVRRGGTVFILNVLIDCKEQVVFKIHELPYFLLVRQNNIDVWDTR